MALPGLQGKFGSLFLPGFISVITTYKSLLSHKLAAKSKLMSGPV